MREEERNSVILALISKVRSSNIILTLLFSMETKLQGRRTRTLLGAHALEIFFFSVLLFFVVVSLLLVFWWGVEVKFPGFLGSK